MSIRQQVSNSTIFNRLTFRIKGPGIKKTFREADTQTDLSYPTGALSIVYQIVRVFLLMVILILGLVGGSTLLAPKASDPLASYGGVMPGQSVAILKTPDYEPAPIPAYDQSGAQYYMAELDGTVIDRITISSRDGTIEHVTFFLNRLQFGYLVLRWGRPDTINVRPQRYIARWQSGIVATGNTTGAFGYHTPVQILSIEG
jgi:hypothetical protein